MLSPRIIGLLAVIAMISVASLRIYRRVAKRLATPMKDNNEAATRADEGAFDYDACRDAGQVWRFRTGKRRRLHQVVGTDLLVPAP